LRIAVDARFLTRDQRGMGRYVRSLLRAMARLPHDDRFFLIHDPRVDSALEVQASLGPGPWEAGPRRDLKQWSPDCAFFPWNRMDFCPPCPGVPTLHDATPFRFPYPDPLRILDNRSDRSRLIASARRADLVLTGAWAMAADLTGFLNVPAKRIRVVPHGAAPIFQPPAGEETGGGPNRAELGPGPSQPELGREPYLLTMGAPDPRKNMAGMLEAYAILRQDFGITMPLAVLGGKNWSRPPQAPAVIWLEHQDDSDLALLYGRALVFIFPSLYEGFGLPIIEAMACGTPVVAMNNSVMPEVGGDAARYAPVGSPRELAGEIHRVMVDRELRRTMSRQGIEWAARFTWEASARGTRSALQEAATGSPATDYTCPIPNPGTGARPASGTIPAPAPTSAPTISTAQHNKEDQIESTD